MVIVQLPGVPTVTKLATREQLPIAVKLTGKPDEAEALTLNAASPYFLFVSAAKVMDWLKPETVTEKVALAALPALSTLVQVTVVTPMGNVLPEGGVHVAGSAPDTASLADAVKFTTAPEALLACTMMFPGTVSAGGVVSMTVI